MSIPTASVLPLDEQQNTQLQTAVAGMSADQLWWVSGYAAGMAAAGGGTVTESSAPTADVGPTMTVLYGSQTGNGQVIAEGLATRAQESGFGARAVSLADFKPAALKRESLITLVISTHGEGDPPDDADLFHEYVLSSKPGSLQDLQFSVLALGDSSYVNFCQTGREIDDRLAELGAKRFEALVECDLDYTAAADGWATRVLDRLPDLVGVSPTGSVTRLKAVSSANAFDRANPFEAEILVNQKITGAGSSKDVRHIELSLEGSGIEYEPGDALGVITTNPPELVDELAELLALDADSMVDLQENQLTLRDALSSRLEITALSLGFLKAWANAGEHEALKTLVESGVSEALADFLNTHQVIDVVRRYPATCEAQQLVDMLRTLSPRSYSIASSLPANPGEVHLTVAAVRYKAFERPHWGAASTMLADRLAVGTTVPVFVEKNPRFRLPAPDVPVIMVGPGTGVAPFRAFVEERAEQGATGDNWLFMGDRNFSSDFLYQLEWQRYLRDGNLNRLDVAFSRDQAHKVYVQDVMREKGAELYRWLERGAVIYVCGDAKTMAGDVEEALLDILQEFGREDRESAEQQLKDLRRAKRYQKDVY